MLEANGNTFARHDPCKVIDYTVNTNLGGPGAEADVHEAIRRVSEASGLQFNFVGDTNEIPQSNYMDGWTPTNRKPLIIAWGNPQTSNMFNYAPEGVVSYGHWGNGEWTDAQGYHQPQIVTGMVYVDATQGPLDPGFNYPNPNLSRGTVLMHELGHAMGLDHPAGEGEIMSVVGVRPNNWGPGDLAGLARVGAPAGCMTKPSVGAFDNVNWAQTSASTGNISVRGWAFDPNQASSGQVHVYVDGNFAGAVNADQPRPDVTAAYNRSSPAGFTATIPATNAMHHVCVYAINTSGGTNTTLGCADSGNNAPIGTFDSVRRTQTASGADVSITGWTFDPDGVATANVHVYIDGNFAGVVPANVNRPDVRNVYGGNGQFGYDASIAVTPGRHNICVYGIDNTQGPNTTLGCRTIDNSPPVGSLDGIALFRTGDGQIALQVAGWAADPDTTNSTQVHVYLDGQGFAIADANGSRPDVAAFLGRSQSAYGFDTARTVSGGSHTVCAYAIDTEGGQNTTLGCTHFTV